MILTIHAVGLILSILVWYSSYWFSSFAQCSPNVLDWSMNVHGMVPANCSKSFGSCRCVVDVSSEPMFNVHVLSVGMHPVDMGRFFHTLCFIIWCRLLDRSVAQTVHTPIRYMHIFVPKSIYNYDLKLNTSQWLIIGGFSPKITW